MIGENDYIYNGYHLAMEFWKPITQEMVPDVIPGYWISNIGNIYNENTGKFLNRTVIPNQYVLYYLKTNHGFANTSAHRLVCMAFNGMPPNEIENTVDHKNSDKTCNYQENLEWVSGSENVKRAYRNNLFHTGEDAYNSIFTNEELIEICEMLMQKIPVEEIKNIMEKKIYPRSYSNMKKIMYDILNKRIRRDITANYNFPTYSISFFTDEEVHCICRLFETGCYDYNEILKQLGKYTDDIDLLNRYKYIISAIKNGFRYTNISSNYDIEKGIKFSLNKNEFNFVYNSLLEGKKPKEIYSNMERGQDPSVKQAVYKLSSDYKLGKFYNSAYYKYYT